MKHRYLQSLSLVAAILCGSLVQAQTETLAGEELIENLRRGGYVIVMRHASSPRQLPDETYAHPDNVDGERQLDEQGIAEATAFGTALRELSVPILEVFSSPAFRALQTAHLAGFDLAEPRAELDNAQSDGGGDWLREQAATPAPGGNRVLITHEPNISAAFPEQATGLAEGEALIFVPHAGQASFPGRLRIDEWPALAEAARP